MTELLGFCTIFGAIILGAVALFCVVASALWIGSRLLRLCWDMVFERKHQIISKAKVEAAEIIRKAKLASGRTDEEAGR